MHAPTEPYDPDGSQEARKKGEIPYVRLADILLESMDEKERNMNLVDLKPSIDFITRNYDIYEQGIGRILHMKPSHIGMAFVEKVESKNSEKIRDPQLSYEFCLEILRRLPLCLLELSQLQTIDYTFDGVLVPGFGHNGHLDPGGVQHVELDVFPREGDHPSRILVGGSNGTSIYLSSIPSSISPENRITRMYYVHVLLHEFFHTIELLRRSDEARNQIQLKIDGKQYTFEQWWSEFESIITEKETHPVSRYAQLYPLDEMLVAQEDGPEKYTASIAEHICETFVAYMLDIVPHEGKWTSFRNSCQADADQQGGCVVRQPQNQNLKWEHMDRLCRSTMLHR